VRGNDREKAPGRPDTAAITKPNDDGQEEAVAVEVGKLRADIELLELTAEYLKGRIKDALPLIGLLEEETNSRGSDEDEKKLASVRVRRQEKADKSRGNVSRWREEYSRVKEQIAKYRYRIVAQGPTARDPLSETGDSKESLAEIVRRIDRLEAKVDQIAKSIATTGRGR